MVDLGFWKVVCTGLLYLSKRNKACEAHLLGGLGAQPPKKIFDFRPSEFGSGAVLG